MNQIQRTFVKISAATLILISLALFFASCSFPQFSAAPKLPDFFVQTKSTQHSGYWIFSQKKPNIQFTVRRPLQSDGATLLSVAGTYTSPKDSVEGFLIVDGEIIQQHERQGWDGAVIFSKNSDGTSTVKILQTNNGALLTKEKLREVAGQGSSLIQAHLLVKDGVAQPFKPQPAYERRALVILSDNSPAIIESGTALDLDNFAQDLVQLGVKDAINLDMGRWSEGWFRDPKTGDVVTIGSDNAATQHQTNWITFQK